MHTAQGKTPRSGFSDPVEFGYERLFTRPGRQNHVISADDFQFYLDELRIEMRKALNSSEKARDTFFLIRDAYRDERDQRGPELDASLRTDPKAQSAVSDNIMYDRWATKYAAVLEAEIAYANYMGWNTK